VTKKNLKKPFCNNKRPKRT